MSRFDKSTSYEVVWTNAFEPLDVAFQVEEQQSLRG
jgi:hypothetical protein